MKASTADGYELLHRGAIALAEVESNGIRIDTKYLDSTIESTKNQIRDLEHSIRKSKEYRLWQREYGTKINLDAREQLGHIIYDVLGHPCVETTATGKPKVDQEAFSKIDLPFLRDYERLAKLKKLKSTYLNGVLREVQNGYLHPVFNLHTVETYRGSSDSPNFQNIPIRDPEIGKLIRSAFIARDDHQLVEVDYSGIEVRIAACYNKDPKLITYIVDPTTDMHRDMAAQLYKLKTKEVSKKIRYCNPLEAPVWMGNCTFKMMGDIKVGDEVMGWHRWDSGKRAPGKQGNKQNRKRLKPSKVTDIHRHIAPIFKVTMASGRTIRCTEDHLWVDGTSYRCWNHKGGLKEGNEIYTKPQVGRSLVHVVDPPPNLPQKLVRTAGWLGGMYDGEGSRVAICQSISHNPKVCERLEEAFAALKINHTIYKDKEGKMRTFRIAGLQAESDFLNLCKPIREAGIKKVLMDRSSFFKKDKIVSIEPDGEGEVIGLTTETGNYIAWGYASKNCAKNMFVFPQFYGDWYQSCCQQLWGAVEHLDLKLEDGTSLRDHLVQIGIQKLGECDPKERPLSGTFEAHVKKVEEDFWNNRFKVYGKWKKDWYNLYLERGWFDLLTGFRCAGVFNRKEVSNYPVQGAAFHCLLASLIELNKWLRKKKMRSKVVGQIHDSIVGDVHKNELDDYLQMAKYIMTVVIPERWKWINVPLDVEAEVSPLGGTWFDKKAVEIAV